MKDQPVVVGVDGSDASMAAAQWAAREALRRDQPLRLVHAWNRYTRQRDTVLSSAAQRHLARRSLLRAGERVRAACPGLRIQDDLLAGPATAALVHEADRAAPLVLGSRGLGGFTGLLVGSVALGVVAKATRPVVLVRADADAPDEHVPETDGSPSTFTGYRDVVLALDVTDSCDEVIEFAFEAARLRGARLRAVYAWQSSGSFGLGPGDIALTEVSRAEEWLGCLRAVLTPWRDKYPDVTVLETVVEDKPAGALVRAAAAASLAVVGHRLTHRTGPVTHAAIQRAGCPVAVVPHG
ncbi:universal stress protein [Streptomyces roseirectus]|uniref:Universal stress protein n=1 Tax=Streptomyces roseirectus TaxID=2768066 RepID=A0A7H0I692_9ACTN|nr:universal stress protein [Streptomyces roseirectus]QNP68308.1 universal stress protein [Streptomyces roseirectus]